MAGMPLGKFLHCNDQFDVVIQQAIALRVEDLQADAREDLAVRIANAVGKLFENA